MDKYYRIMYAHICFSFAKTLSSAWTVRDSFLLTRSLNTTNQKEVFIIYFFKVETWFSFKKQHHNNHVKNITARLILYMGIITCLLRYHTSNSVKQLFSKLFSFLMSLSLQSFFLQPGPVKIHSFKISDLYPHRHVIPKFLITLKVRQ